jgi:hypothetical protein
VSCGACPDGEYCDSQGLCECTPGCTNRQCGPDGCGGNCPPGCGPGQYCDEDTGTCQCASDCAGRECGPDGCGGSCGECDRAIDDCDDSGRCVGPVWQDPPPATTMTWQEAIAYCEGLSLDGHDDWRLPTISELRSLVRGCQSVEYGGACGVTDQCLVQDICRDDSCSGCGGYGGPAEGCYWPIGTSGTCSGYWSISRQDASDQNPWMILFNFAAIGRNHAGAPTYVRCVR